LNYEFRWSGRWQVYFDQMPKRSISIEIKPKDKLMRKIALLAILLLTLCRGLQNKIKCASTLQFDVPLTYKEAFDAR